MSLTGFVAEHKVYERARTRRLMIFFVLRVGAQQRANLEQGAESHFSFDRIYSRKYL
jgi:hypothetical protein